MDVISHVTVQKPCSRVFCYEFNCLKSPGEKVIYISSVVLICLWTGKTRIVRVVSQILPYGIEIFQLHFQHFKADQMLLVQF